MSKNVKIRVSNKKGGSLNLNVAGRDIPLDFGPGVRIMSVNNVDIPDESDQVSNDYQVDEPEAPPCDYCGCFDCICGEADEEDVCPECECYGCICEDEEDEDETWE